LALDRCPDRRVVQQHDSQVAVHDLLQASGNRLRLARRLGVHLAQQRLAEVRENRAGEAADEALRADDAEIEVTDLARAPRAVEDVDAGVRDDGGELVGATGMEVVVAEDGEDGYVEAAAR